ncbi:MAG: hypothetical protein KBA49_06915, partial [Methanolinea sp.]|nr:hypothetical protein [Methanolinea sp.]
MAIKVLMRLIVLVSLILAGVTVSAGTPFFDLQTEGSLFGFSGLDIPGANNDDPSGLGMQQQMTIPLQFIENAGQSD